MSWITKSLGAEGSSQSTKWDPVAIYRKAFIPRMEWGEEIRVTVPDLVSAELFHGNDSVETAAYFPKVGIVTLDPKYGGARLNPDAVDRTLGSLVKHEATNGFVVDSTGSNMGIKMTKGAAESIGFKLPTVLPSSVGDIKVGGSGGLTP